MGFTDGSKLGGGDFAAAGAPNPRIAGAGYWKAGRAS